MAYLPPLYNSLPTKKSTRDVSKLSDFNEYMKSKLPDPNAPTFGGVVTDVGKKALEGAARGAGTVFRGGGELVAGAGNVLGEAMGYDPMLRSVDPLTGVEESLAESISAPGKRALGGSQISGDITDPSTYSFGEDPSAYGIGLQAAEALGQVAPQVATAVATGGASVPTQLAVGAGMGGLQGIGAGAGEAEQHINSLDETALMDYKLYADLRANNVNHEAAKARVAHEAKIGGAIGQGILAAAPGAIENFLIGAVLRGKKLPIKSKVLGGTVAGTTGAAFEGAQEVAEGAAGRFGSNVMTGGEQSLTEGSFPEAVLGAMPGGVIGGVGGAVSAGGQQLPPVTPSQQPPVAGPSGPFQPDVGPQHPFLGPQAPFVGPRPVSQAEGTLDAAALSSGIDYKLGEQPIQGPQEEVEQPIQEVQYPMPGKAITKMNPEELQQYSAEINNYAEQIVQAGDPNNEIQAVNEIQRRVGILGETTQEDMWAPENLYPVDEKPALDEIAKEAATSIDNELPEPTEAQKEAGNYKKAHPTIQGMNIAIENPKGSERSGKDKAGNDWSVTMNDHYGYLKGTKGFDKDQLDVFMGPTAEQAESVYVVDQITPSTGKFDEHKVMMGYDNIGQAEDAYRSNYNEGWTGLSNITEMPMDEFKQWAYSNEPKKGALIKPETTAPLIKGKVINLEARRNRRLAKQKYADYQAGLKAKQKGPSPEAVEDITTKSLLAMRRADIDTLRRKYKIPLKNSEGKIKTLRTIRKEILGASKLPQEPAEVFDIEKEADKQIEEKKEAEKKKPVTIEKDQPAKKGDLVNLGDNSVQEVVDVKTGENGFVKIKTVKTRDKNNNWQDYKGRPRKLSIGEFVRLTGIYPTGAVETEVKTDVTQQKEPKITTEGDRDQQLVKDQADQEVEQKAEEPTIKETEPAVKLEISEFTNPSSGNVRIKVTGDTKAVKDEIKAIGGAFWSRKFKAWTFAKSREAEVRQALSKYIEPPVSETIPEPDIKKPVKSETKKTTTEEGKTDLPKKHWGIVSDNTVIIAGSNVGVTKEYLDNLAKTKKGAKVLYSDESFTDQTYIPDDLIFGHTWDEIKSMQQGKSITKEPKTVEPEVKSAPEEKPKLDFEQDKAKADLDAAMGDLASIMEGYTTKGVMPIETEQKLLPVLTRLMDAAFRLGYYKFKDNAKFVLDTIRSKMGDTVADAIDIDYLQGSYVAMSKRYKDTGETTPKQEVVTTEELPNELLPTDTDRDAKTGRDKRTKSEKPSGEVSPTDKQRKGAVRDGATKGTRTTKRTTKRADSKTSDRSGAIEYQGRDRIDERNNYTITSQEDLASGSAYQIAKANLDAIKIAKRIASADNDTATDIEQGILAKYAGWGASEIRNKVFPANNKPEGRWKDIYDQLNELLTPEELKTLIKSTQYAHYTSKEVIDAMYNAIEGFGFESGSVFEGGVGSGNFMGLIPKKFTVPSYTGLEMDSITADIAQALYPDNRVIKGDFTKINLPDNHFNLVIGNPPFADTRYKLDGNNLMIHDYFIAKQINALQPGSVGAFVTSTGTMDKVDPNAREYIDKKAVLLGAIRLPKTTFKGSAGTSVTTDLLFFQKRDPANPDIKGVNWIESIDGNRIGVDTSVNEYFVNNPKQMLGTPSLGGQFKGRFDLLPSGNLDEQLNKAVASLPKDVIPSNPTVEEIEAKNAEYEIAPKAKASNFYIDENNIPRMVIAGVGTIVPGRKRGVIGGKTLKQMQQIRDYIPLRNALMETMKNQGNDTAWKKSVKKLNTEYDNFVRKHGPLNQVKVTNRKDGKIIYQNPIISNLEDDAELFRVISTEQYNETTGEAKKGDVYTDQLFGQQKPVEINSAEDALAVTLNEKGYLDMDYLESIYKIPEKEIIDELGDMIYKDPVSDHWITADDYLSGNVKAKLAFAKGTDGYQRNIDALEVIIPEDKPLSEIPINLGAFWIDTDIVKKFAEDRLDFTGNVNNVIRGDTSSWSVIGKAENTAEFGTAERTPVQILDAALNRKTIRITYKDKDGKTIVMVAESTAANEKVKVIRDAFMDWAINNEVASQQLHEVYNRDFNTTVPRKYDGSMLTFPGLSSKYALHDWQQDVVWRIIQNGNTYMAHTVGAGKTLASIVSGMELKRLGLANKPTYVVLKSTLKQFAAEFYDAYPNAKLLIADENQLNPRNRRHFMGKVSNENWDAVIITHQSFEKIPMGDEFVTKYIENQIEEYKLTLEEVPEDDLPNRRNIENTIEKMEAQLEEITKSAGKDKGVTFEDSGMDQLFVDEAHTHKKVQFPTAQNSMKGIDPKGSGIAMDMFLKSRYLNTFKPNKNLVLMSGTPVTNTINEFFNIQRFLQPDILKVTGTSSFDAWSSTFAESTTSYEMQANGQFKPVTRLNKFVGLPGFLRDFLQVADIVGDRRLEESTTIRDRPSLKNNSREIIAVPIGDSMKQYMNELDSRIKAIENRKGPAKKGQDIVPVILTDGRSASIDMRLVGRTNDVPSKLDVMIDNAYETWKKNSDKEYTTRGEVDPIKGDVQLIFTTINKTKHSNFSVYNHIRETLVKKGVPRSEVAFIQDYGDSKKKKRLFNDVDAGKVRIVIGGTQNLGTGTNVQKRLDKIHHLSIEYRPADLTQREGRMVRQGNQNKEVESIAYAAEGTVDAFMWGLLEAKASMINRAMTGDLSIDSIAEVSNTQSQLAMAKAIASGNPALLEIAELSSDVSRLNALESAYVNQRFAARRTMRTADDAQQSIDFWKEEVKPVAGMYKDTAGNKFNAELYGKKYNERAEFLKALNASPKVQKGEVIGKVGNLPIYGSVNNELSFNKDKDDIYISGEPTVLTLAPVRLTGDLGIGAVKRLENTARNYAGVSEDLNEIADKVNKRVKNAEKILASEFDKTEELNTKSARLLELEDSLKITPEPTETLTDEDKVPSAEADYSKPGKPAKKPVEHPDFSFTGTSKPAGLSERQIFNIINDKYGRPMFGTSKFKNVDIINDPAKKWRGKYQDGKITLNAYYMTKSDAVNILHHEKVHEFIKQDAGFRKIATDVVKRAFKNPNSAAGKALEIAIDRVPKDSKDYNRKIFEETIAYLVQYYNKPEVQSIFRKVAGAIAKFFRGKFGIKMNEADAVNYLKNMVKAEAVGTETEQKTYKQEMADTMVGADVEEIEYSKLSKAQVDTPAFKKWFGNSKVVDKNGDPLVVYHGTDEDFNTFIPSWAQGWGKGIYFTDNKNEAIEYGKNLTEAYLRIEKPFTGDWNNLDVESTATYKKYNKKSLEEYDTTFDWGTAVDDDVDFLRNVLDDLGYDGIVYKDSNNITGKEIVVFNPNQIKSAVGNRGTYSTTDDRIDYSALGDTVGKVSDKIGETFTPRAFKNLSSNIKSQAWGLLNVRQIADVLGKHVPLIKKKYIDRFKLFEADANEMKQTAGNIANARQDLPKKMNQSLADVQHEATIEQYDPNLGKPDPNEKKGDFALRKEIYANYESLSDAAKNVYKRERDWHTKMHNERLKYLVKRIEEIEADEGFKTSMIEKLHKEFDKATGEGPYFPLARFGKYWVSAETNGEKSFDMFQNEADQKSFIDEIKADRNSDLVGAGIKLDNLRSVDGVSSQFMADVDKLIKTDPKNKLQEKLSDWSKDRLRDDIFQLYLETLPELSARKKYLHRGKMKGYDRDQGRAFAEKARSDANDVARLKHIYALSDMIDQSETSLNIASSNKLKRQFSEHIDALQNVVDNMPFGITDYDILGLNDKAPFKVFALNETADPEAEIRRVLKKEKILLENAEKITEDNVNFVGRGLNELKKSHEAMVNNNVHAIASNLNMLGFIWYLGASPAAAIVNLTQTPTVALPMMLANKSFKNSTRHLAGAMGAFIKGKGSIESQLNANELLAFKEWRRSGLLETTQSHDLSGVADSGIDTGTFKNKVMNMVSYMFHHAEVMNREVTALAAYRAAKDAGASSTEAMKKASDLTWDAHLDYGASNRARFMRGTTMRIITQFKQYSQGISYIYARALMTSFRGESKADRQSAMKLLGLLVAGQISVAGTLGLPMAGVVMGIAQGLSDAFGDEDDPISMKAEFRQVNANLFGRIGGQIISHGLIDALTSMSMSGRLSMADLWIRIPDYDQEGKAAALSYIEALGGPMVGLFTNMFMASESLSQGNYLRAAEQSTPKVVKDFMRTARYATEGNLTKAGLEIKDMTVPEMIAQALGFSSSEVSEIRERSTQIKNIEKKRSVRRKELIDNWLKDPRRDATEIRAWNRKYPRDKITIKTLRAARRSKKRYANQVVKGVRQTKRNRDLIERYDY